MSQNWVMYTAGYKEAGDLLLQNVLGGGRQNTLVYPIIFLYRHYIELMLKEIILNGWAYLGIAGKFPDKHNIDILWGICKDILQKMDKAVDPEFTKSKGYKETLGVYHALEADLKVFSEWDPNSQAFRYPIDKKGNPMVIDLKSINFKKLLELTGRISYELDGLSVGVYDILSQKEEMLSYEY